MILYQVGPLDVNDEFFSTKKEAIKRAKSYGEEDMYVYAIDIGNLTKDTACRLASSRAFAKSRKKIWPT